MANDTTADKPNLDLPVGAGRVVRKLEGAATADNPAGGEVKRDRYTVEPPPEHR